ncbi:unnamed protein product [Lepeophtheirus salmonis]|uniref:(salmon louse) hypothetical protein n=1 Tax=Lepeophtheirus salmonis TaxID=72036 RepID=A0A7R8CII7_LEPSM|nr:unnamed protein product [Lepeophtheirus salmonis]CAF2795863.1 unnamed protein product [Lepeophtheirus salmonis]
MSEDINSEEIINKQRAEIERLGTPLITTTLEWHYLTGQSNPDTKVKRFGCQRANLRPLKDNQVLLADIYVSWYGPCTAIEAHLKRLRMSSIEKPETLYLAKVCCDDIQDLRVFKDDPRPTFLFWARGKPVAMLRGINRPLLTKLVLQEVDMEIKGLIRDSDHIIDYSSESAIQCQSSLAEMAQDEFTHSIGCGKTDKLSTLFQDGLIEIPDEKDNSLNKKIEEDSNTPEVEEEQMDPNRESKPHQEDSIEGCDKLSEDEDERIVINENDDQIKKEQDDTQDRENEDESLESNNNNISTNEDIENVKKMMNLKKSKFKNKVRKKILRNKNGSNKFFSGLESDIIEEEGEEEEENEDLSKNKDGTLDIQSEHGFQKSSQEKKKNGDCAFKRDP